LNSTNGPAHGTYDFTFAVFNLGTNGTVVAGPFTNTVTSMTNGLFSATLDFGSGIFNGSSYWLELGVRTNGGAGFTKLIPRQPIQPVPYAIMANAASNICGSVPATQLSGTIPLAQLPALLVTNSATGVNLSGKFIGDGSCLTNVSLVASSNVVAAVVGSGVCTAYTCTGQVVTVTSSGGSLGTNNTLSILALNTAYLNVTNFNIKGWTFAANNVQGAIVNATVPNGLLVTNASFTVGGFSGLIPGNEYQPGLTVSNSSASSITVSFVSTHVGLYCTNQVPAGAELMIGWDIWPGVRTNVATMLFQ